MSGMKYARATIFFTMCKATTTLQYNGVLLTSILVAINDCLHFLNTKASTTATARKT
jgi:hypothetical protein